MTLRNHHEVSNNSLRELTGAYNEFGFRLFGVLAEKCVDENILLSPTSVALSLALLYHGSGGDTQQAIEKVLGVERLSAEEISHGNAILRAAYDEPKHDVETIMAIALWVDKGFSLDPAFLHLAGQFYAAEATSVDLKAPLTAETINRWAREKTRGKLDRLIEQGDMQADLLLTNAVYFKGLWAAPFDKAVTRQAAFRLPGGKQKSVMMMSRSAECLYLQADSFQALSLDYGDGQFSMYLLLPDEGPGLKAVLGELNAVNWERWLSEFDETQVELSLPRFTLTGEYDLKEALGDMGMEIAFGSGADLGPMGLGSSFVYKIKHKAVVEVNEEGTEAAAASAVFMRRSIPLEFNVDRPFLWTICDNRNRMVLFTGIVTDPD